MKYTVIDKTALKKKSEELEIPFANLLAGYVLESLLYLIEDSGFGSCLWLKNSSHLGVEQYRKKNTLTLDFAYAIDERVVKKGAWEPGQSLSLKMGYIMLAYILKKEKIPEIKWLGRAMYQNQCVELEIMGELDEMTVPIHVRMQEFDAKDMIPIPKELPYFMQKNQKLSYLEYPVENTLAELLFSIINQMELLPEMKKYKQIYQILDKETVDGRHIKEMLQTMCKENNIAFEKERVDTILSYQSYPYMRKRYEKYLRSRKKKEPDWDSVMKKIGAFLPKIWKSICKDTVFFGDWMPELGRFLE